MLYRTALAYYYAGDESKARGRLDELKAKFAADRGVVRGKDVVLADSLASEIQAPIASIQNGRPIPGPSRGATRVAAEFPPPRASPAPACMASSFPSPTGARSTPKPKKPCKTQYDASVRDGMTLGILPVTDRGELFFQDG